MKIFEVNKQKCTKCKICSIVCPTGIIKLKGESFPQLEKNKICINCGHCVSVCPKGAFSLLKMPVDQCSPVLDDMVIPPNQMQHHIRARRSIRNYKSLTVDKKEISKIIDIVRFAPTSQNTQLVNWIIVHNKQEVKRMTVMVINFLRYLIKKEPIKAKVGLLQQLVSDYEAGIDSICHGASHLIITYTQKNNTASMIDCIIALTYLELLLPTFGLGGCWAGYFDLAVKNWAPLQNALDIPGTHMGCATMLVGYPQYKYLRLPQRNKASVKWIG